MKGKRPPKGDIGQIFSGEFLVSFLLFIAALTVVLNLWDISTTGIFETENQRTMEELAVESAEKLVRTPGVPFDWSVGYNENEINVTSIGLANESRVIMPQKVNDFTFLLTDEHTDFCGATFPCTNYQVNLYRLGLGGYDFFFNMTYLNGSEIIFTQEVVGKPIIHGLSHTGKMPVDAREQITIFRTAIYEGEIVRIYVVLWK